MLSDPDQSIREAAPKLLETQARFWRSLLRVRSQRGKSDPFAPETDPDYRSRTLEDVEPNKDERNAFLRRAAPKFLRSRLEPHNPILKTHLECVHCREY